MASERIPMRLRDEHERAKNFDEVALGYNAEEAACEAARCLQCKNPLCVAGCPVGVRIPEFIAHITRGDMAAAVDTIRQTNSLPAVCGRVCPQENQCERRCVLAKRGQPIAIGRLERYSADWYLNQACDAPPPTPDKAKVAVVGAGPAGLTCAGELARLGYRVTVFEALHKAGGVLVYGIPEFRLPKALVAAEVTQLEKMGVDIRLNTVVGRTVRIDELLGKQGYKAVFIGSGAGLPQFMGVPGEDLNGVYSANEFLTRINLMGAYKPDSLTPVKRGKQVIVVGGGNVAMDAARSALRLGAQVTVVYRRTFDEMPARREEIEHAREEGVRFQMLTAPVAVLGHDGWVRALCCQRMTLGEPDASGRRSPVGIPDALDEIDCDQVIVAIGTSPNPLIKDTTDGLQVNARGCLVVREDQMTTREGVYAGGDITTGAATVILAMGAGRQAAQSIDQFIRGKEES